MDEPQFPAIPMRRLSATLLLGLLAGCEGAGGKVKDPVVPPPPRRISIDDSNPSSRPLKVPGDDPEMGDGGEWSQSGRARVVLPTGTESNGGEDLAVAAVSAPLTKGEVAAIVNGQPIFYDDVLVPVTPQLKMAKEKLPPAEYLKFRRMVVEKYIGQHIEQELLLQALRRKMKPEQFEGLQKSLNKLVDEDLKKQMQSVGVSSIGELEVELRKSDLSVETMRQKIRNQKMAEQFLATKAMPREGFDRPDLVAYYQDHLQDYKIEARVRWQQIEIDAKKAGGSAKSAALARKLAAELQKGADFDELARKHSAGPTAKTGGIRDWTTRGSLAFENVDRELFELPVGGVSDPLPVKETHWIVKVLDRDAERYRSFEEVQDAIKDELRRQQFSNSVRELLKDLREQSEVWMFPNDRA